MNLERLKHLRKILIAAGDEGQNLPAGHRFDMSAWLRVSAPETTEAIDPRAVAEAIIAGGKPVVEIKCKTASCALGTAALDPEFKKLGLELRARKYGNEMIADLHYDGKEGYTAAAAFFDLPHREAKHLFSPDAYSSPLLVTPKEVVDRINEVILK